MIQSSLKTVFLALFIVLTQSVSAQESFSLENAKAYALEHHTDIQKAALSVQDAKQQMREVTGMGLPQVDLNGSFNHYINIPVQVVDGSFFGQPGTLTEFRMGTDYNANGTLQVGQLIFNGSYIVGLQVASYYKQVEEFRADITAEEVVFNVIQAYQIATVAKENKVFADSMVLVTQDLIDKQSNYLDLGLMLQEDMDQLNYSLALTKNAALEADLQYENTISLLKFSMGYPMDQSIEITDRSEDLLGKSNISMGALSDNMMLQLLEKQIVLDNYNIKNRKFESLPSLNAYFQQAYNAYRNEFNFFDDEKWYPQTLWGLQLNVPLFSGFQRHARLQQARIKKDQDQLNLEQYERSLKLQEVQMQNNLRSAKEKLELEEANVDLARTIYENELLKEKIGKGNSILVTQKYNQLITAQAKYLGSKINLFNAQLELDKLYNKILSNN